MKEYKQKPAAAGTLIPKDASDELARQDAERQKARERYAAMGHVAAHASFRTGFAASISYEFELARKWGAEADTVNTGWGEEVMPGGRIADKYPPRAIGKFEKWLCSFKNSFGAPYIQREPRLGGFIFNEGGRILTFTRTRMLPFRLYLCGLVLMKKGDKWTLRKNR